MLASAEATAEEIEARYPGWQAAKKELDQNLAALRTAAAAAVPDLSGLARSMALSIPKMDSVISRSTASGADLRALMGDVTPLPYAIERVEREVTRLVGIAAAMADNTGANAEIARTGLEQSIAMVAGLGALHETTRQLHETTRAGIAASDRRDRVLLRLTRALVGLTVALVLLTAVLAGPVIRDLAAWVASTRSPAPTAAPSASISPSLAPTPTPAPTTSATAPSPSPAASQSTAP